MVIRAFLFSTHSLALTHFSILSLALCVSSKSKQEPFNNVMHISVGDIRWSGKQTCYRVKLHLKHKTPTVWQGIHPFSVIILNRVAVDPEFILEHGVQGTNTHWMRCQSITGLHVHTHIYSTHKFTSRSWEEPHIDAWRTCTESNTYRNWKCEAARCTSKRPTSCVSYRKCMAQLTFIYLKQIYSSNELLYGPMPQLLFRTDQNNNTYGSLGQPVICCWIFTNSQRWFKKKTKLNRFWLKLHFIFHQRHFNLVLGICPQRSCLLRS